MQVLGWSNAMCWGKGCVRVGGGGGGEVVEAASHLTDLRLTAASRGHSYPPEPSLSFTLFFSSSAAAALFPLSSFSSSVQRQITKSIVGVRQRTERARRRVGWRGAFISGSLHFAWHSLERRQSQTSIVFFLV